MNPSHYVYWGMLLLIGLGASACKPATETPEPDPTPIMEDPVNPVITLPNEANVLAMDMSVGFRTEQLKLSENVSWTYTISVPENIDEGEVPLIIALHGGSGNHVSSRNYMQGLPYPALQYLDAIIFAPTGGQWWEDLHSQRVVEFVRLAKLHLPIDSNKVAVTGYSNGGSGSVYFAKNHPNTFSAAIPMGAEYREEICPSIPTYMIHGKEDEFYPSVDLQRIVNNLQGENCDIQLHLVEGASHGSAYEMVGELAFAGAWLQNEIWKE